MNIIQFLAATGIFLSLYAHSVELHARRLRKYKALCDFSEKISCTKAFTSKYARILGVPNSLIGIIYYAAIFVLGAGGIYAALLPLTILGAAATIILAYISYIKLKNFCVVCTATYLVNIILLILSV